MPTVICAITRSNNAQMFSLSSSIHLPISASAQEEIVRRLGEDEETMRLTSELGELITKADLSAKADIAIFSLTGEITPQDLENQLKTADLNGQIVSILLKRAHRAVAVIVKTKEDYEANGTLTPPA